MPHCKRGCFIARVLYQGTNAYLSMAQNASSDLGYEIKQSVMVNGKEKFTSVFHACLPSAETNTDVFAVQMCS